MRDKWSLVMSVVLLLLTTTTGQEEQLPGIGPFGPSTTEPTTTEGIYTEAEALKFSDELDKNYNMQCNVEMIARWNYITDVENHEAEEAANEAEITYFKFKSDEATNVQHYEIETFEDVNLYRKFRFQKDKGPGNLKEEELTEYQTLQSSMETLYSTATICDYNNREQCGLKLEPDLEAIMATSTDFDELRHVWNEWRDVAGRPIRDDYLRFIELSNKAATNDEYADTGEYWLSGYTVTDKEVDGYGNLFNQLEVITSDDFKNKVDLVFAEVWEKLYKPLHAFVRMKLKQTDFYADYIDPKGTLPAHILGNMWAQDWTNIAAHVMPFPDQPNFDVTQSMIDNKWNIDRMFEAAEDFFVSIGLPRMTESFWNESVINQTKWGKAIVCHASAEDFCLGPNNEDFRIKMCTQVNMGDLVTVHHEMGHIEYFMAYTDLSHVFRTSANPGFHEAIGDLIALSVSTPEHMKNVLNLTSSSPKKHNPVSNDNLTPEEQQDINFLMRMALEKIAFLPFGYLIDKYRWQIFDSSTTESNLNEAWWKLREELQGVSPPMALRRGENYTDANYFDAGAKYHVPANVPYIRYFVSFIVQFQFHQKLCETIQFPGALHKCDIYNNTEAGDLLSVALEEGFTRPWPLILNELGGSQEMDASAIISYFDPLMQYINDELAANNQAPGWTLPADTATNTAAEVMLGTIDANLTTYATTSVHRSWEYYTNVTDVNLIAMNEASAEFSQMYNYLWKTNISTFDYSQVTDPFLRRQFLLQQSIGIAILDEDDLNEFNTLVSTMTDKLNNKVCPYDNQNCSLALNGLDIDALEIIMGETRDYQELLYYWTEWREVSGNEMLVDYPSYVDLTNLAANLNGFDDGSQMWVNAYAEELYSSANFQNDIESIWVELAPFYEKLHAYVRNKLRQNASLGYDQYFNDDRLIPANILGNMYAQSWVNIYDLVTPYPNVELKDLTPSLEANIDDVREMFQIAEDFFTGIGLYAMSQDFRNNTVYEQPSDRTVICHASAWDFYSLVNISDGEYRIKMCTNKNQEDFLTIHHEMGHIEYYMSYSQNMPLIYRDGANPGFHEAIGDTISLSVSTPSHIDMIDDQLNNVSNSAVPTATQQDINFLMKQALDKVAFMPFAYILDLWRWEVFNDTIKEREYNYEWWQKRIEYQGIKPPVIRSHNNDFDIGCKYHVPTDVPYIRYFVATILQFQFHERLCNISGFTGDIYNCDINENLDAGQALLDMLAKGRSQNWIETLADFLGDPNGRMSANSMLTYFSPLIDYLDQELTANDIDTGWDRNVTDIYVPPGNSTDEIAAEAMREMDANLTIYAVIATDAGWNYNTNITTETETAMNDASAQFSLEYNWWWTKVIKDRDYEMLSDSFVRRQFEVQQSIGTSILEKEDLDKFNSLVSNMTNQLNNKICPYNMPDCDLDTEGLDINTLEILMGTERDFDVLSYYWTAWRFASGHQMIGDFSPYVDLENKAATENNFNDASEMWLDPYAEGSYTSDDFRDNIDQIWTDLEPFYEMLHGYVRMKLKESNNDYSQHFNEDGLIPANILGNMYAQSWVNIYDLVVPYPEVNITDLTPVLDQEIDDVTEMFAIAEDFFTSIGLYAMNDDFRNNTLYEKPLGRDVICHASAWDFYSTQTDNIKDGRFRIKMCTNKTEEDFITIHHEMGHIQYFMAYGNQNYPIIFRNGANPGFHEAIGDTIALSVSTPNHLNQVADYLQGSNNFVSDSNATDPEKKNLNFLMKMALDKIAFLPFAYIIDEWRWSVFDGSIDNDNYNYEWWQRRLTYQGVSPPEMRSNSTDFDIGCKFHVPANVPYIRYFVAAILQFQFHERLCKLSGQGDNLNTCDIYNSTDAGGALLSMLETGYSEPWQSQLQNFLNDTNAEMSSASIIKYFQPLIDWLNEQNITDIGWDDSKIDDYFGDSDAELIADLEAMDEALTIPGQEAVMATWNYDTNITEENKEKMNNATETFGALYKAEWEEVIEPVSVNMVYDDDARRQVQLQSSIGIAILEEDELSKFNGIVNDMADTMNNEVCDFDDMNKCNIKYGIDELEVKMGTERDYTKLMFYWDSWREETGQEYVEKYPDYITILNNASVLNDFSNGKEMWINKYTWEDNYRTDDFTNDVERLMEELSPFYVLLQCYVREKLKDYSNYGKYFEDDNLIPAHILGNMYAQSWTNIYDIVAPYPEVNITDISQDLKNNITDVKDMFDIAEEFFTSIGLYPMTPDFKNNSLYEQPDDDTAVVCHASAMDFRSTEDNNTLNGMFRIKMCTDKNQEDFITIHHEMGHIEYFMAYSDGKPLIYRNGANPGFHEAIGDTIALSVSTQAHLDMIVDQLRNGKKVNNPDRRKVLQDLKTSKTEEDNHKVINFLMKQALDKIAFLPYAYILDSWRWDVFTDNISRSEYNYEWWRKRIDYQGVRPPAKRTREHQFDIGCKYHVAANVPYIRYFIATILQFQFHQKLCQITGQESPLHECDIYNMPEAGAALKEMLIKGASEPWQDQLLAFLGDTDNGNMSSQAILNYFEPLIIYLNDTIDEQGWDRNWKKSDEVLDNYFTSGSDIGAVVPIVVGAVLAVLVCIVVVAFFVGQKRRKKAEAKAQVDGKINEAMEMESKDDL